MQRFCSSPENGGEKRSRKKTLHRLKAITVSCRDDMHEPDEQNVSAKVVGDHLDNAFGDTILVNKIPNLGVHQEFVVVIDNDGVKENFNLATLIALARKAVL